MLYKNVQCIMYAIVMVLPFMTNGMYRLPVLSKQIAISTGQQVRRSFYNSASELRKLIATPKFNLTETQQVIMTTMPKGDDSKGCARNGLIEFVVFKATEFKKCEKKYANVLAQLEKYGWSVGNCCVKTMLHSAVRSDLSHITNELLHQRKDLVHETDLEKCTPLHYAKSPIIAQRLINYGAEINVRDKHGNTPLHLVAANAVPILLANGALVDAKSDQYIRVPGHGWKALTPLRKAVDEGDHQKCYELLTKIVIDDEECEILQAIADLQWWRTKDKKFMAIKRLISKQYSDKEWEVLKSLDDVLITKK